MGSENSSSFYYEEHVYQRVLRGYLAKLAIKIKGKKTIKQSTSPKSGFEGTLLSGYVAQSDWLEERSVSFLLSFSLSVFPFSSLGGETANPRHLDDSPTKRRGLFRWFGEEGKRCTLYRWLPSNKENGDISLYRWLFETSSLSIEKLVIREASVAEDYEAGGGLVDEEDNDGWVATHGRPKGCLIKMVLRLFDQVSKAHGKKIVAEEKGMKDFETMWSIRQQDLVLKERLSKMRLLDSLIAKKEPLIEYEEALEKLLLS
ncbi:hypothetical protein F2Q69_00062294 [Brassica cretica]|uniref:Uncharacterized protein n=1 Tax=Brassica cretica TaxID=69181 RepID=A0A8S9RG15_BRACR|nr:hypothetical protein F2Q69_00062294 [Brassica cretica]